MNADLVRILCNAYSVTDDESIRGKICHLIRDEASKDFPITEVSLDLMCEDWSEHLGWDTSCAR